VSPEFSMRIWSRPCNGIFKIHDYITIVFPYF
jgi:hypothetical protein